MRMLGAEKDFIKLLRSLPAKAGDREVGTGIHRAVQLSIASSVAGATSEEKSLLTFVHAIQLV